MKYSVVIPAYNEARFIGLTLDSLMRQTVLPVQVVVANDNSTDETAAIAARYAKKYPFVSVVSNPSQNIHLPGSKVIRAFNAGLKELRDPYDIIVKLDADLILPDHYFETVCAAFSDPSTGMAGGFAYIQKDGQWVLESLADHDHIRGAFKAYRRELFEQMQGLRPAMGWDTADELLARYYGWKVVTLKNLKVKHLKPTGASYDKAARYKQGESFYTLGYGFSITLVASIKLAAKKGKPLLFFDYLAGFLKAKRAGVAPLVTPDQAKFIRNYRYKKMLGKIGVTNSAD